MNFNASAKPLPDLACLHQWWGSIHPELIPALKLAQRLHSLPDAPNRDLVRHHSRYAFFLLLEVERMHRTYEWESGIDGYTEEAKKSLDLAARFSGGPLVVRREEAAR